jgi:hypothetical protein
LRLAASASPTRPAVKDRARREVRRRFGMPVGLRVIVLWFAALGVRGIAYYVGAHEPLLKKA